MIGTAVKCDQCGKLEWLTEEQQNNNMLSSGWIYIEAWKTNAIGNSAEERKHVCSASCGKRLLAKIEAKGGGRS